MKQKNNSKYTIIFGAIVSVIIVLLISLFVIQLVAKEDELNKIYSTFTCNSCQGSLLANDDFNALGIKEKISFFRDEGIKGEELFLKTTKLLGVKNIIDSNLRDKTLEDFRQNPPSERAIIELNEDYVNFGNVSESKMAFVMKEFKIKNVGSEDLYIYQVGTSCSCLNTKLVTDEVESPTFGRFSFPYGLTVKIPPGEEQRLRVTYDARVNSFFRGFETRFVYVYTNDVINPTKQITIDVNHID